MPTYEYLCGNCGHEFELFQSIKEDPINTCPECNTEEAKRQIGSGAGIIFKGSGFYETDYKRKSEPKSESKSESNKSETKSSETKSESKTESKSDSSSNTKKEKAA